ncbi:CvpA family protein [Marispirochaeta aestuarii]|uniref:CvpA family protein n=1 Tax=Marispirochaeta aestuarii TaxID=1963862 RepID=UPI003748DB8C
MWGGILFSAAGGDFLAGVFGDSPWNRVIAFLAIFLSVYLILKIAEGLLYRLIEAVHLENLDRALGFFWGTWRRNCSECSDPPCP